MADGSNRVVATLPAETFAKLDALATSPRFAGNRSAALAWCVEIAASVLTSAAVADRLFAAPGDALAAFLASGRKTER